MIQVCKSDTELNINILNPDKPVGAKRKSRFIGEPKMICHEGTKTQRYYILCFSSCLGVLVAG